MLQKLKRVINNRERYYILSMYRTLFGNYCLERVYGATNNKAPTGQIKEYFCELNDAQEKYDELIKQKKSKGYVVTFAYKI